MIQKKLAKQHMIFGKIYKNKKTYPLLKAITAFWIIIIFYLSFIPGNDLPKVNNIPNLDKIVHFSLYAVFTFLCLLTLSSSKKRIDKKIILGIIFAIGVFVEIMQGLLPIERSFSFFDMLANTSGILTGFLIFSLFKRTITA